MSASRRKPPPRRRRREGPPRDRRPSRRGSPAAGRAASAEAEPTAFEAEVLPGLAPFARAELAALPAAVLPPPGSDEARADAVAFGWRGSWEALDALRTVTAVERVTTFPVPRPKALLGDEHLRALVGAIGEVRRHAVRPMRGLRLEAAGRDSPVMLRLRRALATRLELTDDPEEGELRLRLRPAPGGEGWQALVRLTPRPLSARAWRACNRPGGLNACVAAAAWALVGHAPGQRVLNAMCGSGTLLIERAALGPAARLVGIDVDEDALACAARNRDAAAGAGEGGPSDAGRAGGTRDARAASAAARRAAGIELLRADATRAPFGPGSFDAIVADPPWGDAIGERGEVEALHPAFLQEAARLLSPGGRLLVVTHALRAFEAALEAEGSRWRDEATVRVFHGGHRPALRLLRRR